MAVRILFGERDSVPKRLVEVLEAYDSENPGVDITLYRQNSVSVRVRVIDPRFKGLSKDEQFQTVWSILDAGLDDDAISQVTSLLTFSPGEAEGMSFANFEFEHPLPSKL